MAETCNGKRVDVKLNGQVCSIRLKYVSNEAFRPEELTLRFSRFEVIMAQELLERRAHAESEEARKGAEKAMLRARAIHAALLPARCANAGLH